jgi:hypothetical protein
MLIIFLLGSVSISNAIKIQYPAVHCCTRMRGGHSFPSGLLGQLGLGWAFYTVYTNNTAQLSAKPYCADYMLITAFKFGIICSF